MADDELILGDGAPVAVTIVGTPAVTGAVTVASGGVASGAVASGAVASGAVASGAVASGAIASGAVASGAVVDGALVTIGAKADNRNAATDTTAISVVSILKQISYLLGEGHVPFDGLPFGQYLATKTVTFSNTTGTVNLFTVTGLVVVRFVAICNTALESAGACNISLGVVGATDTFGPSVADVTGWDAGEIWDGDDFYATPVMPTALYDTAHKLLNGEDIIATLSAQIDSGAITAYCFWTPLSTGATVVAAA